MNFMRLLDSVCASCRKVALSTGKKLSAKGKRCRKFIFPTIFITATLSFSVCIFMNSCANAEKEKGKMIAFEKDIDLHIPFLSGYVPFIWSPDSRCIAFGKGVDRIGIVNIETDEVREISGFRKNSSNKFGAINNLAWSPDQKLLAAANREELWIIRLADGKVVNEFSAVRDLPVDPQVRFSKIEFSEDSKKLVIASLYGSDYALLNSFDLATNTLTPMLYPPCKPLMPPPGFGDLGKRVDPEDFRFTRYQGHLYYTAIMRRQQEYWDYAKTFPRDKFGTQNPGGDVAIPVVCMVADLGDGKEVRSVTVLNFPEYTLTPGIQLQDQSECLLSRVHYYPPANALVVLRGAPYTQLPDGSWHWSPNKLFETFTINRQPIVQFGEQWSEYHDVISEQVLHPFKPLLLYSLIVPVDEKLRQAYVSDGNLHGNVPITVEMVVWDILTGKEIDRIPRHQSYPEYKNASPLGLVTDPISISPDGKHFTYYQGGGNLLPLYKITIGNKEN